MNLESLKKEIEEAINRNSVENVSDTPDFILADYLMNCLDAYHQAVTSRKAWTKSPSYPEGSLSRKYTL